MAARAGKFAAFSLADFYRNIVITGFNTDVEHQGVVYHVQTEDKGAETPLILSLVYNRGAILASKRSPYDDLLTGGLDEKALAARLQKQHKTICAAVSAGRFEDLKRMTAKDSAARHKESFAPPLQKPEAKPGESNAEPPVSRAASFAQEVDFNKTQSLPENASPVLPPAGSKPEALRPETRPSFFEKPLNTQKFAEKIDRAKAELNSPTFAAPPVSVTPPANAKASPTVEPKPVTGERETPSTPEPRREPDAQTEINAPEEIIVEAVEIIEDEVILPAEAVAVVADFSAVKPPEARPLKIEFLAPTALKSGERKTLSLLVCRGSQENGVAAQIMIKILGTSFRPLIFHVKTDAGGVATVHLQLPHFRAGRAALLARAIHGGEQAELRRAISHG